MVLLDEVEKAHPEVFDVLLQVLDDGRLTDGQGRTVDFRNTILVLTSNLGSQFIADPAIDDETAKRDAVMAAVRAAFKPEFLNRLDDVIVFDALSTGELTEIVDLQVGLLAARLAGRRLTLTVTPAAKEWLALTGFDPVYGARPLRRLVQSAIGDQLARALLSGEIIDGDEVIGRRGRRTGDALTVARAATGRAVASCGSPAADRAAERPGRPAGFTSRGGPGLALVQQLVVVVLAQAEVDPDPVAQAQQQLQLARSSPLMHGVDPGRGPVQRAAQVALLGEQLGDQVAGARQQPGAGSGQLGEQRLGLGGLRPSANMRPGQRDPGIIEGRAGVRDRGPELVAAASGLVGQQPLLARPHVRLGPGHAAGRDCAGTRPARRAGSSAPRPACGCPYGQP